MLAWLSGANKTVKFYWFESSSCLCRNIRRTVEVWLDEYRPYFYEKNAYTRDIPYGE